MCDGRPNQRRVKRRKGPAVTPAAVVEIMMSLLALLMPLTLVLGDPPSATVWQWSNDLTGTPTAGRQTERLWPQPSADPWDYTYNLASGAENRICNNADAHQGGVRHEVTTCDLACCQAACNGFTWCTYLTSIDDGRCWLYDYCPFFAEGEAGTAAQIYQRRARKWKKAFWERDEREGHTRTPAASTQVICERGAYTTDDAYCEYCPAGKYQNDTAATDCHDCAKGTYSDTPGTIVCKLCPQGRYNGALGLGPDLCPTVPPGYDAQEPGQEAPTACTLGHYASEDGTEECPMCPEGWYAPAIAQTE